ncbi:MAG: nucleotidyltransferase domain-containing protein [Peptococcaceae bacterium]|nr:nucleotidyltransferase domain-containing protein [Peptococcaceae bacterium]
MDKEVVSLYLFGSYAEDKQTPASDVDLAVLLEMDFPAERYFEKKLELLSIVTSSLKTGEVDLIILNQAPPFLSYQILSKGRLLFTREDKKGQKVNFQVRNKELNDPSCLL